MEDTSLLTIASTFEALSNRVAVLERMLQVFPQADPGAKHQRIIDGVARLFDIGRSEMLGPVRTEHLAWPRHVAMYLITKYCGLNNNEVGKIFRRHHTAVRYGVSRVLNRVATETTARDQLQLLESQLAD